MAILNFLNRTHHVFDAPSQKDRAVLPFFAVFLRFHSFLNKTRRFDNSLLQMMTPASWLFIERKAWMSDEQWLLCSYRRRGMSYAQVRLAAAASGIEISGDQTLATCFRRTACGEHWVPGDKGGQSSYLCLEDEQALCHEIVHGCEELASCPTDYVLNYAQKLRTKRMKKAFIFLQQLSCHNLAENLTICAPPPSRAWLGCFCERFRLRIKWAEKLDGVRRRICDKKKIQEWFLQFSQILQRYDSELILNMDETGVSTNRRYKVVVPEGSFSVVPNEKREIHLTCIVTFSATGKVFKPGVILPNLRKLPPDLEEFREDADFYASKSGWMTKMIFELYCVNLAHEIHTWRATLDPRLRSHRVLLLLDGHGSRRTAKAMRYLHQFGIDVLTFPGHSTHILQPFDVGIAGVFKGELLKQLQRAGDRLSGRMGPPTSAVGLKRWCLVASCLEALQHSLTRNNCRAAFRATGICPFSPERPLSSHLILERAELTEDEGDWINCAYFAPGPSRAMQTLMTYDPVGASIPITWPTFAPSFSSILTRMRPMTNWTTIDIIQPAQQ